MNNRTLTQHLIDLLELNFTMSNARDLGGRGVEDLIHGADPRMYERKRAG